MTEIEKQLENIRDEHAVRLDTMDRRKKEEIVDMDQDKEEEKEKRRRIRKATEEGTDKSIAEEEWECGPCLNDTFKCGYLVTMDENNKQYIEHKQYNLECVMRHWVQRRFSPESNRFIVGVDIEEEPVCDVMLAPHIESSVTGKVDPADLDKTKTGGIPTTKRTTRAGLIRFLMMLVPEKTRKDHLKYLESRSTRELCSKARVEMAEQFYVLKHEIRQWTEQTSMKMKDHELMDAAVVLGIHIHRPDPTTNPNIWIIEIPSSSSQPPPSSGSSSSSLSSPSSSSSSPSSSSSSSSQQPPSSGLSSSSSSSSSSPSISSSLFTPVVTRTFVKTVDVNTMEGRQVVAAEILARIVLLEPKGYMKWASWFSHTLLSFGRRAASFLFKHRKHAVVVALAAMCFIASCMDFGIVSMVQQAAMASPVLSTAATAAMQYQNVAGALEQIQDVASTAKQFIRPTSSKTSAATTTTTTTSDDPSSSSSSELSAMVAPMMSIPKSNRFKKRTKSTSSTTRPSQLRSHSSLSSISPVVVHHHPLPIQTRSRSLTSMNRNTREQTKKRSPYSQTRRSSLSTTSSLPHRISDTTNRTTDSR